MEVRNGAARRRNLSFFKDLAFPSRTIPVVDIRPVRFTSEPNDNFALSITVKISSLHGVCIEERVIDHLTTPQIRLAAVNDNLISVPGFDGRQEPLFAKPANADITRPTVRPRLGAASCDFRSRPFAILAKSVKMNPSKAAD